MLSVPTLWLVFVVNFTALGLIWTYVARSYPNFSAAPFWTASAEARRAKEEGGSDEAIHSYFAERWIASRSLSSGARSRDPLARNDGRSNHR